MLKKYNYVNIRYIYQKWLIFQITTERCVSFKRCMPAQWHHKTVCHIHSNTLDVNDFNTNLYIFMTWVYLGLVSVNMLRETSLITAQGGLQNGQTWPLFVSWPSPFLAYLVLRPSPAAILLFGPPYHGFCFLALPIF